jgi:hypothetical protein
MMGPSIKELYVYALAEGEGVGTAYEYYVKRRVLGRVLGPGSVLVAGLPEKYGTSADFLMAAEACGGKVLVVDDREAALERSKKALDALRHQGRLLGLAIEHRLLPTLDADAIAALGEFGVVLSCEVVQRLAPSARGPFVSALRKAARRGAVFTPNSENPSHLGLSGLAGLTRREMRQLAGSGAKIGLCDLPPFPPGITRSSEQREKASSGLFEAVAMRGLEGYSLLEKALPERITRRVAHIVYASWSAR